MFNIIRYFRIKKAIKLANVMKDELLLKFSVASK